MNDGKTRNPLLRKMQILEQINTKMVTESRFVHRREMRGLRRLLRETASLIDELDLVNQELEKDDGWRQLEESKVILQAVTIREQEVLNKWHTVQQEAITELKAIGAELNGIRVTKNLKQRYLVQPVTISRRNRIDVKR